MPESELINLETKIDSFVKAYQQLRTENNSIRGKLSSLTHENALLIERKRKAIALLKKIIAHLKDELLCHKK